MTPRPPLLSVWLLAAALFLAVAFALGAPPETTSAPSGDTQMPVAPSEPVPIAIDHAPVPRPASTFTSGMAPMPNDAKVPTRWLPPGSFADDSGPSDVVFPAQQLTIRFNHKLHLQSDSVVDADGSHLKCETCHGKAKESRSVSDKLTPAGTVCDSCHTTSHANLAKVIEGGEPRGKCAFCHVGYKEGDGNLVARFDLPRANMVFDHKKHVTRNIGCPQCHGAVQELELATRDQLPRMRGCFTCHQMTDSAARGEAKSDCLTCHLRTTSTGPLTGPASAQESAIGGTMRTLFASGRLTPPRWLHNAAHTPDWIDRHKTIAGNDSQFCATCHKEEFCVECHDGRVRPRSIHPNDYISMHPIEARQSAQKCTSCHREQSFCLGCHQRLGVSMSGPADVRMSSRFHPAKEIWSDPPRKPGHHSFEAERNLNACVSCHIERDCVICHGGTGIGGGFDPHGKGFAGGCATQFRRNPRPCYVCHEPGAGVLNQCR